jgi:hypothetical protein
MRFQVPQFIEVEDKIFGPLTFKQFIYLGGGVGICAIFFTLLPKFIALLLSGPFIALSLALAFYKINEKPFISVVESFVSYSFGNKLYIWKKEAKAPTPTTQDPNASMNRQPQVYVPKFSESKLKDLSFALDIKENENPITK